MKIVVTNSTDKILELFVRSQLQQFASSELVKQSSFRLQAMSKYSELDSRYNWVIGYYFITPLCSSAIATATVSTLYR